MCGSTQCNIQSELRIDPSVAGYVSSRRRLEWNDGSIHWWNLLVYISRLPDNGDGRVTPMHGEGLPGKPV